MRDTSGLWKGGSAGRPKGTPNKTTRQVRAWAERLIHDAVYRQAFEAAWRARQLPHQLEMLVWAYAAGRPVAALEVTRKVTLEQIVAGTVPPEIEEDEDEDGTGTAH